MVTIGFIYVIIAVMCEIAATVCFIKFAEAVYTDVRESFRGIDTHQRFYGVIWLLAFMVFAFLFLTHLRVGISVLG